MFDFFRKVLSATSSTMWRRSYNHHEVEVRTVDGRFIANFGMQSLNGSDGDASFVATFDPAVVERMVDALEAAERTVEAFEVAIGGDRGPGLSERFADPPLNEAIIRLNGLKRAIANVRFDQEAKQLAHERTLPGLPQQSP